MTISGYSSLVTDRSIEIQGGTLRIPLLPQIGQIGAPGSYVAENWLVAAGQVQQAVTGTKIVDFVVPHLRKGRLSSIVAVVIGGSGHAALPANLPLIMAYNSAGSAIGTGGTDGSATFGVYEIEHSLTITVTGERNLSADRFHVRLTGEGGANSEIGFTVRQLYAIVVPELEES